MSAGFWDEVERLFTAALDLPPARRLALLDEACAGRPGIRAEVESLLAAHDGSEGFLQEPTSQTAGPGSASSDTRRQAGRIISHYELLDWIGAGAMGEVYRARDLALGRPAALKLLPVTFDVDVKRRLLREAEASAKLQHPAIATFYEAGEADGETFIAMEFVEGCSLRHLLNEGGLPIDDALAIACCLLEALAHAHAAALVHRDVKPENIIVVGNRFAKLLDFSIAKPLSTAPDAAAATAPTMIGAQTSEGGLVGTIGYLAPEQIAGGVDARTDVFQLGAVLCEMLTGRPAFPGTTLLERLAALMRGEPDLGAATLPPRLTEILRCALQQEPAKRYQSAAAFLRDLRELTDNAAVSPALRVLAIFDFANRAAPDADWLGSALANELRRAVARQPDLRVIDRDRTTRELLHLAQEHGTADPLTASVRLGCRWAVLGEVEATEPRLCASASLVDVATGDTVATEQVVGALQDLAEIHERLAGAIVGRISEASVAFSGAGGQRTFEAERCYTQARLLIDRISKGSLEDARTLLELAIASDPQDADALAALATTHALRAIATTDPDDYGAALAAADRALAVDPRHVASLVWKSYALAALARQPEAERAIREALAIHPHDTEALYFAAGVALFWNDPPRIDEAVDLLRRAVCSDESRGMWWVALGTAHRALNSHREALYSFARAERLEGTRSRFNTAGAAAYTGETLRREGRLAEAREAAFAGLEAAERSDHSYRDTFRAHALTVIGRVALDEQNLAAANAAFHQVLAQARGRPQPRACGHFVVQALCGLARSTKDVQFFQQAHRLIESRDTYNFSRFYGALDGDTFLELALAAGGVGRHDEASAWFVSARRAGWRPFAC